MSNDTKMKAPDWGTWWREKEDKNHRADHADERWLVRTIYGDRVVSLHSKGMPGFRFTHPLESFFDRFEPTGDPPALATDRVWGTTRAGKFTDDRGLTFEEATKLANESPLGDLGVEWTGPKAVSS